MMDAYAYALGLFALVVLVMVMLAAGMLIFAVESMAFKPDAADSTTTTSLPLVE